MNSKLETAVIRRLMKVGVACAPQLADEIEVHASQEEILKVLKRLEERGYLQRVPDERAGSPYQVPYQLSRASTPAAPAVAG